MKNLKLIFLIALTLIIVNTAFAQSRINGRVVGVVDGKTIIIEMPNRTRLVAELQYIEVPEAGQPLYAIAAQHLRDLVLDEIVEFRAKSLTQVKTVGQLFLKGVDVSQQMIRDGAAWYAVLEKSSQDAATSAIYQNNEAQAKTEKLGIWSIENLKPSWEVRAELVEKRRQQERTAQENFQKKYGTNGKRRNATNQQLTNNNLGAWSDVNGYATEQSNGVGGLEIRYDAAGQTGMVATTRAMLNLTAGNSNQQVDFRMGYFYADLPRGRDSIYLIGAMSEAKDWKFLKSNSLIVIADGEKIVLGKAYRLYRRTPSSAQELLLYKISRSQIAKIAKAKNTAIKLGTYSGKLSENLQTMLRNMLEAAS